MASLHKFVSWWTAPQLRRAGTMFLVKLLQPVRWQADAFTYRGVGHESVRVRVCASRWNGLHPDIGEEFLAKPRDLIAVQVGAGNN